MMTNQSAKRTSLSITHAVRNIFSISEKPGVLVDLDQILEDAIFAFRTQHSGWPAAAMSDFFVEYHIRPLILQSLDRGQLPSPLDIAMLWDYEFGSGEVDRRNERISELRSALVTYVDVLKRQL